MVNSFFQRQKLEEQKLEEFMEYTVEKKIGKY